MAFTWESIRAELNRIGSFLIPVISTTSATAGAATHIVDTKLWVDPVEVNLDPDRLNGMWVFLPDDATADDRERQVGNTVGIDLTNGYIYMTRVYSGAVESGDQYEIMIHKPTDAFNKLVGVLEQFKVPVYGPMETGLDEDMEDSDASAFSVSGAGSVTKVATAGNVDTGTQALFFNAGTAGEYAETGNYRVSPGDGFDVSSCYRVDDGGPVAFAVWDKTNDAEIQSTERVSHSFEGFYVARRNITVPAGCEEISLRWYVTAATDNVYIDRFRGPQQHVISAPAWMTRNVHLQQLLVADYRESVNGDAGTVYPARSRVFDTDGTLIEGVDFNYRSSAAFVNRVEIELTDKGFARLGDRELWYEGVRPAADAYTLANTAAGESSPTVNLDKRMIAIAWGVELCEDLLLRDPSDPEANAFLDRYTRMINGERVPAGRYADLIEDYQRDLVAAQPQPQRVANPVWSV